MRLTKTVQGKGRIAAGPAHSATTVQVVGYFETGLHNDSSTSR